MFDLTPFTKAEYVDLMAFVKTVINFAINASVLLVVIAIVIAGFKYIFSRGDEKKIQDATRTLVFSLIGLILVFISPLIVRFVINQILGVK